MKYFFWISMSFLFFQSLTFSGTRVNNGGGAWVCRAPANDEWTWIQIADFLEPLPEKIQLEVENHELEFESIVQSKLNFLEQKVPQLFQPMKDSLAGFNGLVQFVSFSLEVTSDRNLGIRPPPSTCENGNIQYIQVADYLYVNRLLIDAAIWNHPKFSPMNKAGLMLHERIYKTMRDHFGDTTPLRSRKIVAWLFSNATDDAKAKNISWILQATAFNDRNVATFAVAPRCDAVVDDFTVGSWQPTATTLAQKIKMTFQDLIFYVETSTDDGIPSLLKIRDQASHQKVTLPDPIASAAFKTAKIAKIEYQRFVKGRIQKIILRCWNQI